MKHSVIKPGFTLIELLLVIAVISILISFVLIALEPQAQFAKSNDIRRRADVNTIMNGIWQYTIDNNGNLPGDLNEPSYIAPTSICLGSGAVLCAGLIDVWQIREEQYVSDLPGDPKFADGVDSNYEISKSSGGILTISAPLCEQEGCSISIER